MVFYALTKTALDRTIKGKRFQFVHLKVGELIRYIQRDGTIEYFTGREFREKIPPDTHNEILTEVAELISVDISSVLNLDQPIIHLNLYNPSLADSVTKKTEKIVTPLCFRMDDKMLFQ